MPDGLGLTVLATASLVLMAAGVAFVYHATYGVRSQWLGPTVWRGRRDMPAVALTFDDGPSQDTERILDVLAEHNVCATFFMIGRHVESLPQTARRVVAEGHGVGNHSYSHPIFLYRAPRGTLEQLERAQAVITKTTGVRPRLARPPCGVRTPAYFRAAEKLELRTVQWDVAGFDWRSRSAKQIAGDVLRQVVPGSIILLHDGDSEGKQDRRETVVALPLIMEGLRERGLRVVPLTEMLVENEVELAA
ncbi:MAG: polysaccharide deacetylase family protein [Acidobacteriota bacterium]